MMALYWPYEFEDGITEFPSKTREEVLTMQLIGWGNVLMGNNPPDMFYEVMDAASEVTGAFTATECRDLADQLLWEKKKNESG